MDKAMKLKKKMAGLVKSQIFKQNQHEVELKDKQ